jgi:glycosyltransferase involved in cell wall biosynthesis
VAWALRDILPLLWQRMPNARFAVCGYAMPAQWARQWPDPRVEWLGFVPDLTVQQAQSAVFLAPLREGGGSKLKVLEALAAGMPLASTPQGVSGLAVADGEHYLAGHDAASLADALYRLLAEPARAGCMGEAGRHYATSRHDWQVAADQLETLYRERPHAHRS